MSDSISSEQHSRRHCAVDCEAVLKQELAAIRARREQECILCSIPSIIVTIDGSGRVTRWNAFAEKTFGVSADRVMYKPLKTCPVKWQWSLLERGVVSCRAGRKPVRLDDLRFTRPDGNEGIVGFTISPLLLNGDWEGELLLLGADITERRLMERQIAQATKMESIGRLAAGIAHEINTPTQYIGDNLRFLQECFDDVNSVLRLSQQLLENLEENSVPPEQIEQFRRLMEQADIDYLLSEIPLAISQSLEGVERVTRIVRAMKEFSHPGTAEMTPVDINHALENTITVARNEWKYVADVVTDFAPNLPPVPCLPGEINQVFLNIIVNAAHAIADVVGNGSEEKGTITVSTSLKGNWVEVRISDTGTGIPESIRSKIFDPFFTTKEVGRGTGQGLAYAHSVVEKHRGIIDFETEERKGTTFIIRLPLAQPQSGAKEAAA